MNCRWSYHFYTLAYDIIVSSDVTFIWSKNKTTTLANSLKKIDWDINGLYEAQFYILQKYLHPKI